MRSAFAVLGVFVGCAIGIVGAHLVERPDASERISFRVPSRILLRGNFGAIDMANHELTFNATDPYTLGDSISLELKYSASTSISVGKGQFQSVEYTGATSTINDITPGTAGFVVVERMSGPLQASSIFDEEITNADL